MYFYLLMNKDFIIIISTMSGYSNTSVEYPNLQNCLSVDTEEDHSLSPHVEENVISSGFL